MLRIWGRASSSNSQKVFWCLAELGVDYERVDTGGKFGGLDAPQYLALNPNGRVPTLEDRGTGFVLWESNAIVRYLCARHGQGSLLPGTPERQALADMWM
ncbi:MAG: glutathione S-transferase N-terminal domain-containing protein [Noviherbaspirillum sp.]